MDNMMKDKVTNTAGSYTSNGNEISFQFTRYLVVNTFITSTDSKPSVYVSELTNPFEVLEKINNAYRQSAPIPLNEPQTTSDHYKVYEVVHYKHIGGSCYTTIDYEQLLERVSDYTSLIADGLKQLKRDNSLLNAKSTTNFDSLGSLLDDDAK